MPATKRGTSEYSFVLGINKPSGMSSHDVVNVVRRTFGERRVGHFGTLDPMASGVLLVGVGPAARLDAYVSDHRKTYMARIVFGEERNTDDAEGEVTAAAPVPACVASAAFAREIVQGFVGRIQQVPPAFCALKRNGKTMYQLARSGVDVVLEPREVEVYAAHVLSVEENCWTVSFDVSKGTYIRSLARDIGRAVGCGAYLGGLQRTSLGSVPLAKCVAPDALDVAHPPIIDPVTLLGFSNMYAGPRYAALLANGSPLPGIMFAAGGVSLPNGELVCVCEDMAVKAIYRYNSSAHEFRCETLFRIGVRRG